MKFSVITVSYNDLESLQKTVRSVADQIYTDYEHIIVDGGSDDGSVEYLETISDPRVIWISEKDRGIYDAMNKGIRRARGEVISFINAGDTYTTQALEIVAAYFDRGFDYVFGSVKSGKEIRHAFKPKKVWYSFDYYTRHSVGFFVKRDVHTEIGLYDLRFRNNADMEFFYKLVSNKRYRGISTKENEVVGEFELGGFSSDTPYLDRITEELRIRIKNGQGWPIALGLFLVRFIRHLKKTKDYS